MFVLPARFVPLDPSGIGVDFLAEPVTLVLELGDTKSEDQLLENHFRVVPQRTRLLSLFTRSGSEWLELEG